MLKTLRFASSLRHSQTITRFHTRRLMSNFKVIEHTVRAQHSRDRFAGAELGRENELKLHAKQYIPKSNPNPKPGDVTIIGAVADAFPKEVLEPMWDDLLESMSAKGRNIRAIWIADPVNQGHSGVLNENLLGPDPSWFDHGRDLLFLINQYQDDIPHPIIGIGHSMGACHLTHLALLHPRLMHSLVMMDPVFSLSTAGRTWAAASANRRDFWPSRKAAADKFRSNAAFKKWDARVLDRYIDYGLRDLPTEQYPEIPNESDPKEPPVTLQTTKAQEVYNYIRPAYHDDRMLTKKEDLLRDFWPEDVERGNHGPFPGAFSRFENKIFYHRLPEIQPNVLYIVGEQSEVSKTEFREARLNVTGTGAGGSGGKVKGRVKETALNCGHLVPFEATKDAGIACAEFVDEELKRWDAEEQERKRTWQGLSRKERVDINDLWMENVGAKRKEKSSPPTKL